MLPYHLAYPLAESLRKRLAPVCEPGKCVVAGSLRRHASAIAEAATSAIADAHRAALVKDIELVVYPLPALDLFGEPVHSGLTPLDKALMDMLSDGALAWPDTGRKNGPRYKRFIVPAGPVALDLFICLPPAQWGYQVAIRTGPWQYSKWLVTARRFGGGMPSNLCVKDAGLYLHGQLLETPEENDFFKALGLLMPPPHERMGDVIT